MGRALGRVMGRALGKAMGRALGRVMGRELELVLMTRQSQLSKIWLLNKKFHGLCPSVGHHSLLFDQGFPNNGQLQCHLVDRNVIRRYFVSMRLYLVVYLVNISLLKVKAWQKSGEIVKFLKLKTLNI